MAHNYETSSRQRYIMNRLSIAAILPHLQVFGGIRRYLALGEAWRALGHHITLYTPEGIPPDWFAFGGRVRSFGLLGQTRHDLAFASQPALLERLRALPADRRVFYCVLEGEPGEAEAARDPDLLLMANSIELAARLARRYRRPVLDGAGGIDPDFFHPGRGARDP